MTRADFLIMVMRAYNIEPDTQITNNFADAGSRYYTSYLAAAKRLGLVKGVGKNRFAPEAAISRQDMLVILYRVLEQLGELPAGSTGKILNSYNDAGEVSGYARNAAGLFAEAGGSSGIHQSNDCI